MIRFLADENFDQRIVRGVLRLDPATDITIVQDEGLSGADDPTVLAYAAASGRVLLTHDANTMSGFAHERVARGEPMPGVFVVDPDAPMRPVIDDILTIAACSTADEWAGQVRYLPLR